MESFFHFTNYISQYVENSRIYYDQYHGKFPLINTVRCKKNKMIKFLKHTYYFFWNHKKFEEEALADFKDASKNASKENVDSIKNNIKKLRKYVIRAAKLVRNVFLLALLFNTPFWLLHIEISHSILTILRCVGYGFILWGVLSQFGNELETWDRETLPEIFNEELHKFLYTFGLLFILFSYMAEI